MERLLRVASPWACSPRSSDVDTGRHLGNFPAGVLRTCALDRGRRQDHPGPSVWRRSHERLRRDHHRDRGGGGAPLARHLAPSASESCLLERGGLARLANRRTGAPPTSSSTGGTSPRTPGTTGRGKAFQPQMHYLPSVARPSCTELLRCIACGSERTSGELQHHDGSHRVADLVR
jgi:hypothetical protein